MTIEPVDADRIRPLRHAVLRTGMPADTAIFEGDDEPATLHLAAIADGLIVGCVSVMRRTMPDAHAAASQWQLRGMATAPAWRGRGVGAALLREVHRRMADQRLWCNARVPAIGFYERHGWTCVSDVFDVPTAGPHRRMIGPVP